MSIWRLSRQTWMYATMVLAVFLAVTMAAPVASATPVASDSFDYAVPGGLNGQVGGSGFGSNAWTFVSGQASPALAAGSMEYTSGTSSLVTAGNKLQPASTSRSTRNFPSVLSTTNQTYWVSFRIHHTGTGSLPSNHAGFSLFSGANGSGTEIFMGKGGNATNWGMWHSGGSSAQKSGAVSSADRDAFLVYKLEFTSGQVTISMWVNPALGAAPSGTPDASVTESHSTTIASLRFSTGSNASGYQFDEFRMGTTFADVSPAAVLLAYDGFDYTGNLNTQNGGVGFGSNAWTAVSGQANPVIGSGSLSYTSGSDSLATAGNKLQPGTTSRSMRNFPGTIPTANQTYWVSFRANQTGTGTLPSNHAGFHLYSGTNGSGTYIFLGKPGFGATNWGMDHSGTWVQKSGGVTTADRNAFLVYKLEFTASDVTISMWVNPSLASESALGTPDRTVSKAHTTSIASMNVSIGGNAASYQFDEFRMGTTFATVAPTGGTPPQQPPQEDIVLFAGNATTIVGDWQKVTDASAGGGFKMYVPDEGETHAASASPQHYFELTFNAPANVPYRLWVRLKADSNSTSNDAVHVQFTNSKEFDGDNLYRISSSNAATVSLQEATGRPISGWGWQGNAFGPRRIGPAILFTTSGTQTVRISRNEDGVAVDRIVLSPSYETFFAKRPGSMFDDTSNLAEATVGLAPTVDPASLRILEANIHKYRTTAEDGAEPDRTVSELAMFNANLIGTNETESNYGDELETRLEQKTGAQWYSHYDGGGNLILSRFPINNSQTYIYSVGGSLVRAEMTVNGRTINLFVTHHHADNSGIRATQRAELLALADDFSENRIIIGDLNVSPSSSELNSIKAGYIDSWNTAVDDGTATAYPDNPVSYFTRTRRNRLDYIFRSTGASNLTVVGAAIPDMRDPGTFEPDGTATGLAIVLGNEDDKGIRASDHNWMIVNFEVD